MSESDDDDVTAWLDMASQDIFPKMKQSLFALICLTKGEETDPFLALQLGAALLMGKPLIIIAIGENVWIPERLRKLADAVIVGSSTLDADTRENLRLAIRDLMVKRGLKQ